MKTQLTIKQFKELTDVSQKDMLPIEKEIAVMRILNPGLTDDAIDAMSVDEFRETTAFDMNMDTEMKESFKFDGITYTLNGNKDDFKFSVRQMVETQKAMSTDPTNYIHKMMAAVYTSEVENDRAQIFFDHMPASYAFPFLNIVSKSYTGKNFSALV